MKKIVSFVLAFTIVLTMMNAKQFNVYGDDGFSEMSYRWRENLVGNLEDKGDLVNNKYIQDYIKGLDIKAESAFETMNQESSRISLWTRNAGETKSAYLTRNFKNLATLTKSYGTLGSIYYEDADIKSLILDGLEFLVEVERYDGKGYYGNWWDWQIGIPSEFLSILFILGDEIETARFDKYVNVLNLYLPDPYKQIYSDVNGEVFKKITYTGSKTEGANRADLAHSVLGIGVLKKDASILKLAIESLPEIFQITKKGNGFREDGMFIFHDDTPYIGSYGVSLFKSVASILSIVADTPYDMNQKTKSLFIKLVNDSTLPFINKGKFVGMVEGRSISRPSNHTDNARGSGIVKTLSLASQISTDEISANMFKAVKYWVSEDVDYYISTTNNYEELKSIMTIIATDVDMEGYVPFDGAKVFPSGDRFVYSDENTYIGISMYSNRISAYTVGNQENLKGWHLSDGFVYMMNDDKQFGKSYWPTVDYYRLPGTTVDTRPLLDSTDNWKSHLSKSNWAGGTYSNKNASVSMLLDKNGYTNNGKNVGMDLVAKKSWFMMDGSLVSIGSGISGTTPNSIETIIENKMLDDRFDYKLVDDKGNVVSGAVSVEAGDMFLLKSNSEKNSIAYQFLNNMDLNTEVVRNSSSYRSINGTIPSNAQVFTEDYQMITQNYGKNATNKAYAYVQTQGLNEETMAQQADRFTILRQDNDAHAVYDSKSKTLAATMWSQGGGSVNGFTINTQGSLLVEDKAQYIDIHFADPSQSVREVKLSVEGIDHQDVLLPSNVKRISDNEFVINTDSKLGNTHTIRLIKTVDKIDLEDLVTEVKDIESKNLTPHSQWLLKNLLTQAELILADTTASEDEVKAITVQINDLLANTDTAVQLHPINVLIQKSQSVDSKVMSDDSYQAFKKSFDALVAMKQEYNVFEKLTVTSAQLSEQYNETLEAYQNLVMIKDTLNYKKYNALLNRYQGLDEEAYTVLSYGIVSTKLSHVKSLIKQGTITQQDLDQRVKEVTKSIEQLEERQ